MSTSKYEKYVIRDPVFLSPARTLPGSTLARFLNASEQAIKEAKTILSYAWVEKDTPQGKENWGEPQSHDFDEIFLFMGLNRNNSKDLGAEIEFWMGYGKDTEIITLNTSSMIFIPRNVIHLPIKYKNVRKPLLRIIIGLNVDNNKITKYPLKEL
jgi:hypothetical protein